MADMIQKATTAQVEQRKAPSLAQYIKKMEGEIMKALPAVMTPERFTRIALSAVSATPKLAQTTPQSFLAAMMTAAQLGMEVNTPLGQAYLIPYENRRAGVTECQFQLGYKGMIDLAYRSGQISIIQAQVVHANDKFEYSYGLEPTLNFVPASRDRGEPTHVFAMFKTKDGGFGYEVMSMEDVRAHARKFSKSANNGPWQTNFEEMAKKTVLKKVLKYAPLKSDFVRAVSTDSTVKEDISDDMTSIQATFTEVDEPNPYVVDEGTGEVVGGDGDGH